MDKEMCKECWFYRPRYISKCACIIASLGLRDVFASSKFSCDVCPHKSLEPISIERRYESELHFGNS